MIKHDLAAQTPAPPRRPASVSGRGGTLLLYFVAGQLGWFACVLSAAAARPWIGLVFVALLLGGHLARSTEPAGELKLIAAVTVIGAAWESGLVLLGLLRYPQEAPGLHHAPYWIIALWALFAAQLNVVYGWMKSHLWLAALLGAVAGPLSFRAGAALHALQIGNPWTTMPALALGWACLLPVAVRLSLRWSGGVPAQR